MCFLASFLSFPFIIFDPSKKDLHLNFTDFVGLAFFVGLFFFVLTVVPAIIFLNTYWKEFIFDSKKKVITIVKRIFFFRVGKIEEIPFSSASLALEHRSLDGGRVWYLILNTGYNRFDLCFSLFKGRIDKHKTRLEQILK